jgi:apolipoprotein N-acyltransferase
MVAMALPPWGFWPLSFIGVALFDLAVGTAPSTRQRAAYGWLFGAGWMFLGMGWMIQLTGPGYIVAGAIFGGYHSLAAWLAPTGRWSLVGRPACHTLAEALRFSFPFGGVPLASMGIAQVGGPVAPIAGVGGVILLTWFVFQVGTLLGRLFAIAIGRRSPSDRTILDDAEPAAGPARAGIAVALCAVCAALVMVSYVAPDGSRTGETIRIAAVQGGGEQGTSALEVPSSLVTQRHLDATATIEPDDDLDLVLWPENTIDVVSFEDSTIAQEIVAEAARLDVPIAVGLTEDVPTQTGRRFTNAHVVVSPDGEIVSRYDKVRRVPFGEYVPLRSILERITSAVDRVGDAVAGTTPAVLELPDGTRLATVISWEIFFGGRVREGVELGGEAVINPTNGASYTGTIVQTQQVASSRLRAIETGRWVVQVAPTGFTAVIDADGTVIERTSQRAQEVIVHDIELRSGTTWYTSLGDGAVIAALIVVAGLTLVATRLTRRSRA